MVESIIHFHLNVIDNMIEFVDSLRVEIFIELLLTFQFEISVIA